MPPLPHFADRTRSSSKERIRSSQRHLSPLSSLGVKNLVSFRSTRRRSALEEKQFLEHDEFAATCICMSNHGLLDQQMMRFYANSTETAPRDSVLFCSRPTVALYTKKLYPAILLCVAAMILTGAWKNMLVFSASHVMSSSTFRFTALSYRDHDFSDVYPRWRIFGGAERSPISKFGLLRTGSPLQVRPIREDHRGTTSTISFSVPVDMDGFFFVTNTFDSRVDPVSFVVHARTQDNQWVEVASSTYQAGNTDTEPGPYPVPFTRGKMVKYDMRPRSWGWIHLNITNALLIGSYLFTISMIGLFTGRQDLIYPIITFVYCFNAVLWFLACFDTDYNISRFARAASLTYGIAGATMCFGERFLWVFILEIGVGMTLTGLYGRYMLWQGAGLAETPSILMMYGVIILGILLYSAISYLFICSRARELIRPDKEKYDELWESLIAKPQQQRALNEMSQAVRELQQKLQITAGPVRQKSRKFEATDDFFRDPFKFHRTDREECFETSLSHLFLFARYLHPILIRKVQAWALQSRGLFRLKKKHQAQYAARAERLNAVVECCPSTGVALRLQGKIEAEDGDAASESTTDPGDHTSAAELARETESKETAAVQQEDPAPVYVAWDAADEEMQAMVKFAPLKLPSRAVAKTVRSYGGDVSRLVDICRQSIVFETVEDLTECLRLIRDDPDVRVERVKNRMDLEHDSTDSAGYRDVNINLRIDEPSTQRIGANLHVCEVQLILLDIANLRSRKGHEHYVAFRDYKSE